MKLKKVKTDLNKETLTISEKVLTELFPGSVKPFEKKGDITISDDHKQSVLTKYNANPISKPDMIKKIGEKASDYYELFRFSDDSYVAVTKSPTDKGWLCTWQAINPRQMENK